jgi:shikimate dehydrogenase
MGAKFTNGLPMLVAQAKFANEYFFSKRRSNRLIEKVLSTVQGKKKNLVLIGMPGCGKTTLGTKLAKSFGREFIDTDALIVEKEGVDIPAIFETKGEEYFRKVESEVIKEVGKLSNKVIATGGGVVTRKENYFPLKSNGIILWLDRDIEKLATEGRPLSKDFDAVKNLYEQRKYYYLAFADEIVNYDFDLQNIDD